jgi:hypothetical protein
VKHVLYANSYIFNFGCIVIATGMPQEFARAGKAGRVEMDATLYSEYIKLHELTHEA